MSTPETKNLHEIRLAVFEHLRGELMVLMGIVPSQMDKNQLLEAMNEMGDVAQAVLEMLDLQVLDFVDGRVVASLNIGEL